MNSKNRIRALSVKQPFAEAILRGEKDFEKRPRRTKYRGRIYLYASQTAPKGEEQESTAKYYYSKFQAVPGDFPVGVLVGEVEIFDCEGEEGNFWWRLRAPERFPEPIKPENKAQPTIFFPFKDK